MSATCASLGEEEVVQHPPPGLARRSSLSQPLFSPSAHGPYPLPEKFWPGAPSS